MRKRVIEYIENGGSITEAAARFQVGRATIYRWLNRQDLKPKTDVWKRPPAKAGLSSARNRCVRESVR
ncbi:MAG TPA: helix-turn-helix domain-containing protein [Oscillatoriaceae cyanobacterium M33_DOE_052]|nr:helix-turn-helix domain-containing protein [Oscillatoriaceae cyanobacterium M33_DOE_052]